MGKREFSIIPASIEHLREILTHLSEEDVAECTLSLGEDFRERIMEFYPEIQNMTALVSKSGITFSIGSVQPHNVVWMLTSKYMRNLSKEERRDVFNIMAGHLKSQLAIHGHLHNRVHENTVSHIKFLEAMGAEFGEKGEQGWIPFVLR